MLGGYVGRMASVDLSTGVVETESLSERVARQFLGGYGLGARILYDRQPAGVHALGPENVVAFLTGPLTGTPVISGARFTVAAKSPLTCTWGDANCGGYFGPALKSAGYDALFIRGQATEPAYVYICDGRVELRAAQHLWGRDTYEVEDMLKGQFGPEAQVLAIGEAGERRSLIACIIHDKGRAAGRSGLGAVMGAKKLKAVVAQGNSAPPLADAERLGELRRHYLAQLKHPLAQSLRDLGTSASLAVAVHIGQAPVRNWAGVGARDFPHPERIDGPRVVAHQRKRYTCFRCPIGCGGWLQVPGEDASRQVHKPQYETLGAFGPLILNDDLASIILINDLCNRAGLDTISAGAAVAFAMECYEHGVLTDADTGGLALQWGDSRAALQLLNRMVAREGLGELLADGVREASRHLGVDREEYTIHVNGQEPGMIDPRLLPWMAATYQLDATPGRHTQGGAWCEELGETWKETLGVSRFGDDYSTVSGARLYKRVHTMIHVVNASGLCQFAWSVLSPTCVPDFLSAVTGWEMDLNECLSIGERIANMRQAFNAREGINPLAEQMPGRITGEPPLPGGPTEGVRIGVQAMNRAYLAAMGWDDATARPLPQKLAELGLNDIAADLW